MPSIGSIVDVRGILDAWNMLDVKERLVSVREVQIAVQFNARIIGQLRDITSQRSVRKADDARESCRRWIGEELLEERVAGLTLVSFCVTMR